MDRAAKCIRAAYAYVAAAAAARYNGTVHTPFKDAAAVTGACVTAFTAYYIACARTVLDAGFHSPSTAARARPVHSITVPRSSSNEYKLTFGVVNAVSRYNLFPCVALRVNCFFYFEDGIVVLGLQRTDVDRKYGAYPSGLPLKPMLFEAVPHYSPHPQPGQYVGIPAVKENNMGVAVLVPNEGITVRVKCCVPPDKTRFTVLATPFCENSWRGGTGWTSIRKLTVTIQDTLQ